MVCKGCNKKCKNIRLHHVKSKGKQNCEESYTDEELNELLLSSKNKRAVSKAKHRKNHSKLIAAYDRKWRSKNKKKKAAYRAKYRDGHPEEVISSRAKYRENHPEEVTSSRAKYRENHPDRVIQTKRENCKKAKEDLDKQIQKFRQECRGPIFTCICCMRNLFQRSVEELKGDLEKKILDENQMHDCLTFDQTLKVKDEIEFVNESRNKKIKKVKKLQEGYSLCRTCIGYLKKSQMPPMCSKNSLEPAKVPDVLKGLTDLEKQLIVKNLVFIKIRQLPKTRMAAMNDR